MDKVRAKMLVERVDESKDSEGRVYQEDLQLRAVYSSETNAEDNSYASATPCALLTMSVTNPAVFGFFTRGKAFYVDIVPVDPPAPAAAAE